MKHQFNLRPFRAIIDSNLYGFARMCTLHYCETDPDEHYFSNVDTNVKRLKKFIKYVKDDKRLHTFDDYFDCDFIYCFVQYIINNDETVKTNLEFLRFAINVCSSMMLETKDARLDDYYNHTKELRDYISELISKITDEEGILLDEERVD